MKRYDIINKFIHRFDYTDYLEIGICFPTDCYYRVNCKNKTGVDPAPQATDETIKLMTSDEFFSKNDQMFDIIFIDGLHKDYQVIRDVENALKVLKPGGTILMHDCWPQAEISATEEPDWAKSAAWCGTAYRAFIWLRLTRPDLNMYVLDTDCGVGVVRQWREDYSNFRPKDISWDWYWKNHVELLNLTSHKEWAEEMFG